jgi:RimJ/RimL family protein N-acetyltransferase
LTQQLKQIPPEGIENNCSPPWPQSGRGRPESRLGRFVGRIRRRLHRVCQRYYIFRLDLATYDCPPELPRDLVIRQVSPDEFREMATDPAFEITDYQLENSLQIMAAGDQCWAAEVDGRIGSYVFVQFKDRFFSPKCHVPLAPGTVYLFRAVTVADKRGRRLAPALVAWLALRFKAQGYTRVLTDISRYNRASLRYADHAGYTRVGSFLESTLGKQRRVLVCKRMRRVVSE